MEGGVDLLSVSHSELEKDIMDAYLTKEPLFVWGRTGIGKSYTIRKVATELAKAEKRRFTTRVNEIGDDTFFLLDRRLTYMNPTDIVGVLYKTNGVSKWHYPDWLYAISKQREWREGIEIRGIVSLEELNLAPELVQNAAYELILDRRVQDLEIADGVAFVAAGNTAEDRAFTFEMPDPLKTRFTQVELKIPAFKVPGKQEGWFYWAVNEGVDGRILSFLSYREDLLFKYVEDARVFPTPRGWEKASRLMKAKSDEEAWRAVAKACGMFAGVQFKQFMDLALKIDVDDLLQNPITFESLSVDNKFAAIASMTTKFTKHPESYAEKLLRFAAMTYTGIYEDAKLKEYLEDVERYVKEARTSEKYQLERNPEFATLLLSNMAAHNRELLLKTVTESDYGNVLIDMIPFLL